MKWMIFIFSFSIHSALADDCASAPMRGNHGEYTGCEIVHGEDVQFIKDSESIPETACPQVCESLSEIDELAAESHQLDVNAGIGN